MAAPLLTVTVTVTVTAGVPLAESRQCPPGPPPASVAERLSWRPPGLGVHPSRVRVQRLMILYLSATVAGSGETIEMENLFIILHLVRQLEYKLGRKGRAAAGPAGAGPGCDESLS